MLLKLLDGIQNIGELPKCSEERKIKVILKDERILDCLVYTPSEPSRGTILMVHGMSSLGHLDPRWIQFSRLFCNCGFTVYAPKFDTIASFQMNSNQIDLIELCVLALCEQSDICSTQDLRIASVSYGVGITLLAAGRISIRNKINGIFAIGGLVDFPLAVHDCLYDDNIDPLTYTLLFYNFNEYSDALSIVLKKCVVDASQYSKINWELYLKELDTDDQCELTKLMTYPHYRREQWNQIRSTNGRELNRLNPKSHLKFLSTNVYFLHEKWDSTLSSEHSRIGSKYLGQQSSLCITPLFTQGNLDKTISKLFWHGPTLIYCFWKFLTRSKASTRHTLSKNMTLSSST